MATQISYALQGFGDCIMQKNHLHDTMFEGENCHWQLYLNLHCSIKC